MFSYQIEDKLGFYCAVIKIDKSLIASQMDHWLVGSNFNIEYQINTVDKVTKYHPMHHSKRGNWESFLTILHADDAFLEAPLYHSQ